MKKFKLPTKLAIIAICLLAVVFNSNAQMQEFNHYCPNKETDANKCEWRGNTCFFCDMQTEA